VTRAGAPPKDPASDSSPHTDSLFGSSDTPVHCVNPFFLVLDLILRAFSCTFVKKTCTFLECGGGEGGGCVCVSGLVPAAGQAPAEGVVHWRSHCQRRRDGRDAVCGETEAAKGTRPFPHACWQRDAVDAVGEEEQVGAIDPCPAPETGRQVPRPERPVQRQKPWQDADADGERGKPWARTGTRTGARTARGQREQFPLTAKGGPVEEKKRKEQGEKGWRLWRG